MKELRLAIRINGDKAASDMRRFTSSASTALGRLSTSTKQLWQKFNSDKASADMRRFTDRAGQDIGQLSKPAKQLWKDFDSDRTAADMRRFTDRAGQDIGRLSRPTKQLWRDFNSDKATAGIRRFTNSAAQNIGQLHKQTQQLWQDFNGFSATVKLFAAAGGLEAIRRTLNINLNFERDLLEMKQNAGMTIRQVMELRKLALEVSKDAMQLPVDIVQGEKAYARAGMKFEEIRGSIAEAARSATVMRASVEQIANMDFDLQSKFGIAPNEMKAAHNMAYYHGNEGRFETAAMAQLAPVYLNALKGVGVKGMAGWNFTGALTQSIMKSAPATEPSQVATLIQQGLGHIAMYATDLGKMGINVKKYGPRGQFGVEGILGLAEAMKKRGLTDIFKLEKAGIRDQEAKKFWLQMMADYGEIRKQMLIADKAAQNDRIGADLSEIKNANFGKIMATEIQVQKLALSDSAQSGTSVAGNLAGYANEHMGDIAKGAAAAGGLYLLNRFNRNRKNRQAGETISTVDAAVSMAAQTQNVFVTNWPASMLSPGEKIRSRTDNSKPSTSPDLSTTEPKTGGKLGKAINTAGKAAGVVGAVWSGWEMGQAIGGVAKELIDATVRSITKDESATLGTAIYDMLHRSKIDTGGQLTIKVEGAESARVSNLKTNDPRMTYNVDAGLIMTGAR